MVGVLPTIRKRSSTLGAVSERRRALAGRFCSTQAIFAAMALLSSAPAIAEPTLEEARTGYNATVDALLPIWTRCAWSQSPLDDQLSEGPVPLLPTEGVDVEWATDGTSWHFSHRSDQQRRWLSYDGSSVWELAFDQQNFDRMLARQQWSLKTRSDFVLRVGPTPGKWLGLYFAINEERQSGASLRQLLHSNSAVLVGETEIETHSCVQIDVGFPTPGGDELPVTVWLDPSTGYLPRRIETRFSRKNPEPDILVVEEFREIQTGKGRSTYFPQRMTRGGKDIASQVELLEVTAGVQLKQTLFRPAAAHGTPTFNMEDRNGLQGHRAFLREIRNTNAGERPTVASRDDRTPTALPGQIDPLIPAYPGTPVSWPRILTLTGFLMLVGAGWHLFRR